MTICKTCKQEIKESEWIKIPELKIEVELEVHDKGKSLKELGLDVRDKRFLTAEQCIWLANSKYAKKLNIFSCNDDFFIYQPFNLNYRNGYVAGFYANSDGANLYFYWDPGVSFSWLGVRFQKQIKKR